MQKHCRIHCIRRNLVGMWKHHCTQRQIEESLLGSSLSSSLEIILFTELLCLSGCMQDAGNCCGFDHMFSLLKRCKYSLYSDTMLHFWVNKPLQNYTQSRTNERCTYVHLKNLFQQTWIHCCASWKWICIENAVVYIQSQQWMRKDEINSQMYN